jgi:hypothetical protein
MNQPSRAAQTSKSAPIKEQDIELYLANDSDFAFELRVVERLTSLGLSCQHCGVYEDPVTGKYRQFDIRARATSGTLYIHLAVECKNIREANPLLAYCVGRSEPEAYHELLVTHSSSYNHQAALPQVLIKTHSTITVDSRFALYGPGRRVAKSVDQLGRVKEGPIKGADDGVHDKVTQAINSAYDLLLEAIDRPAGAEHQVHIILPVLVIPNDRLWVATYNPSGQKEGSIRQSNHVQYWMDHTWDHNSGVVAGSASYRISHLEIVTFDFLGDFINEYLGKSEDWKPIVPQSAEALLMDDTVTRR